MLSDSSINNDVKENLVSLASHTVPDTRESTIDPSLPCIITNTPLGENIKSDGAAYWQQFPGTEEKAAHGRGQRRDLAAIAI